MAIRKPLKDDFDVTVHESSIEVVFKPTESYYVFNRLVEPTDVAKYGPLAPGVHERHAGVTGDTGEYPSFDVRRFMARRLALEEARRSWK